MSDNQEIQAQENNSKPPRRLTRRTFLVTAASAMGVAVAVNCAPVESPAPPATPPPPTPILTLDDKYLHVPPAPNIPPVTYRFFEPEEARTLEAFVGRLLPGTDADPGAREAGVALFIDNLLATSSGFAEPTYFEGPFARGYEGDTRPPDEPGVIWVPQAELSRYGFQMRFTSQEIYRMGLESINKLAQSEFGANFADLSEGEQDELVTMMAGSSDLGGDSGAGAEGGNVEGFGDLTAQAFFEYTHKHVVHGNRDFAGWNLIGYPGAQRAYTVADLKNENFSVPPQSLAQLDPLHAGHRTRPEIILPVQSGREP